MGFQLAACVKARETAHLHGSTESKSSNQTRALSNANDRRFCHTTQWCACIHCRRRHKWVLAGSIGQRIKATHMLATFNTPFGCYRWKRMPFDISSAPEVWQRKMHETIEGMDGTEVIADDFLITGKDDAEHDANLQAFLNRCCERNLVLNAEKVRYKLHEVSFMGCLLTDEDMKPDPRKVEPVLDMPTTEVVGVRRLIGTV